MPDDLIHTIKASEVKCLIPLQQLIEIPVNLIVLGCGKADRVLFKERLVSIEG